MSAWAAEAAQNGSESIFATPDFWVLVGFVLFIGAIIRSVYRVTTVALDDRAETIKNRIDEATKLAEDAQEMLASYERKQRDATREAENIVEHARREAERLADQAAVDLERSLKRREQLAMDRIAQAESTAIDEIRNLAVEVAMEATRRVLTAQVTGKKADDLIDQSIKDLPGRLN